MSIVDLPRVPMDDKLGSSREQWEACAAPGETGYCTQRKNKMDSIKRQALKNTAKQMVMFVATSVLVVVVLRFIVDIMRAVDIDPATGLATICILGLFALLCNLAYTFEISRLRAIERLNNRDS